MARAVVTCDGLPARRLWLILLLGTVTGGLAGYGTPRLLAASVCALTLVVSSWMMHATVRAFDLRRITIPAVWYLTYVLMMYVPSVLIVLIRLSPAGYPYRVEAGPHLAALLLSVNAVLIAVPVGVWTAGVLLAFRPGEIAAYFSEAVVPEEQRQRQRRAAGLAAAIAGALVLSAAYLMDVVSRVGSVPLFELLKVHGEALARLRIAALVALNSPLRYVYAILINTAYPFLLVAALGYTLRTGTRRWLILFVLTLLAAGLSAAVSTARSGPAVLILVAAGYLYLYRGTRVRRGMLAVAVPVLAGLVTAMTMAMYRIGPLHALRLIAIRLVYTSAYVQYLYFRVVPERFGFLHGTTSSIYAALTGQPYFNMQEYIVRIPYPSAPAHAMTNGPFVGDLYVNFGLAGVVVGAIAAGVIMGTLQIWLIRQPKTVVNLAVYAVLLYVFWTLTDSPLPATLWSGGVFFTFVTVWLAQLLGRLFVLRPQPASQPQL